MARKREVRYRGSALTGKYLTEEDCQDLDWIIEQSEIGVLPQSLEGYRSSITDLTPDQVDSVFRGEEPEGTIARGTLRDEQIFGFAFSLIAKRLILGDSVGLGKTVIMSAVIKYLHDVYASQGAKFRYLYLTELNTIGQTQRELVRFTGLANEKLSGRRPDVESFISKEIVHGTVGNGVVGTHSLLNQEAFHDYIRLYREQYNADPFDILIVDESAVLSNTATARFKNAKKLSNNFEYIINLNATPFESNLRKFFAQLTFIDDTFLPTKTDFSKEFEIMEYGGMYPKFSGRYKNAEKFREMVKYRYFARTRRSLGATMTNCTAQVLTAPMTQFQKSMLNKTSMPQMLFDNPVYFDSDLSFEDDVPKVRLLLHLLDGTIPKDEPVLVYCHYKETQYMLRDMLSTLGYETEVLNGETPSNRRDGIIEDLQLGDLDILITNVQKGLNFGNVNHCVFYTYDPNPNQMVQFEGRMTRSFHIDGKHVYVLLVEGREEQRFNEIISNRAKASDMFAGSDYSLILSLLGVNNCSRKG